ncbi:restriction endonuclease subunit S [Vibrio cholerae]|uniref:restriction endonuclease subunit S n=1 Tax=Vibrio cholerae TaxID=666 RepID=UPI00115AC56F|nr:restriction endonuclease subunit S [Vibrio cholerae]EGQ7644424.1 restriction endonuclease subunit S [Vibrio cholerae]TQO87164.1 restriction endonuclease subunit S [Vibrio cholerae]TQP42090.1 restriction endonuclease subunit S [Vibrio cholerae]TQQ27833.1 restriction endonuclease subunit S [Vibrio cholerae]
MELNWQNAGGKLPEGWTVAPLRDFLVNEKSVSVGVMYPGKHDENGVPLIKVGDVKNGKVEGTPESRISLEVDEEYKRTRLSGDELLITLVGNPGECVIVQPHMKGWNAARALAVLRLKDPDTRQWLNMVLQSRPLKHIIDSRLNTTVQKTLNLKDVKELPIPTPNIGIHTLCRYYYDLDQKITLNRQINQTLEQMAQTLFKSWFVDFDPVIDNALDAGNPIPDELQHRAEARKVVRESEGFKPLPDEVRQQFPDAFEESELGWVPKGWGVQRLDVTLDLAYGKALKKTDRIDGDVPVYGSGGVNGTHNVSIVDGPGIIVGRKGTVGSLYWEPNNFYPIDTVFYVKPKSGYSMEYCYELLKTLGLEHMNTDAAVPGLNRNNAYRLVSAKPTPELIELFTQNASVYRSRISHCCSESNTLTKLRDTLLPKLISGELRLDEVELAVEQEAVSAEQQNER